MSGVNRLRPGLRARPAACVLALSALGVTSLTLAASAAQAAPAAGRVTLAGTHPSWAVAAHRVGHQAVTSGTVRVRVYLAPRNAAGLAATALAVSTPGSASYRHFLSPAQVRARYGASAAQVSAIRSWLRSAGLRVTSVHSQVAGGYLAVSGSVAAAGHAFGVRFARYRVRGQGVVRAPQQAASVPAGVAAGVLEVTGLSTARQTMRPLNTAAAQSAQLPPPGPNFFVARPCGHYYTQKIATGKPVAYGKHQPWAVCGYTPRQIRSVYGVTASGATGAGQTVAIVDAYASPTMPGDANQYARVTGRPALLPRPVHAVPAQSTFTGAAPNVCGAQGWYGEQTLDIESVHGDGAASEHPLRGAASCFDADFARALSLIVNNHLASIVSNSWGEPGRQRPADRPDLRPDLRGRRGRGHRRSSSPPATAATSHRPRPGLGPDPGRLPDLQPAGHLGRRHQPGHRQVPQLRVRDLLGDAAEPAGGGRQEVAVPAAGAVPGGLRRRQRRRHVHRVHPARPTRRAWSRPRSPQRLPSGRTAEHPMRVVPDVAAYADPATGFLVGQTVRLPPTAGASGSRSAGSAAPASPARLRRHPGRRAAGSPARAGLRQPGDLPALHGTHGNFRDVTDHPLGPGHLAQVRTGLHQPGDQGQADRYLPAHARHRRRGRRRTARHEGL